MTERRILYLDLVGGVAGDMLLAALVDVGASLEAVRQAIGRLGLSQVTIELKDARPAGLRARQIDVMVGGVLADSGPPHESFMAAGTEQGPGAAAPHDHPHAHGHRPYRQIRALLEGADFLPAAARALALDVFRRLAEAEGEAHGVDPAEVTFHEVGADDAITDVVGVAVALTELAVDEVHASPVPVARGLAMGGHGAFPLPGPATLRLLLGVPLEETPLSGELVTPTGAALLTTIASRFGGIPSMVVDRIGVGAGHRQWPDRPNVVRALLGRGAAKALLPSALDVVVEANLDDFNPQHLLALERALFLAGALDVWSQPIQMKKGRPGLLVSALAPRSVGDAVAEAFLIHSTTLGVRLKEVTRLRGERRSEVVSTPFGPVHVKVSSRPKGPPLIMPEHDDCQRAAEAAGTSIREVWEAALRSAWEIRRR